MSAKASRLGASLAIIALALPILALGTWLGSIAAATPATHSPFTAMALYTPGDSTAATAGIQAAERGESHEAAIFERMAQQPTAIWLTPERHPIDTVGSFVGKIALEASIAAEVPVFVIYGIPGRDCGNHSAGGLDDGDYRLWVATIAGALYGSAGVVILEPDALALSTECGNVDAQIQRIRTASETLVATGVAVYLDAGHSRWHSADTMADLLYRAGVHRVRGFSTNVSNFNSTAEEESWAGRLSDALGGVAFVIDTSRNGNGANGKWCNPSGRALGETPSAIRNGTAHDANLWVKIPGESDGPCNGAPGAGQWWRTGALALARNAGW